MLNHTPRAFVGSTTFHVDDMTCPRCRDLVIERISALPGVTGVSVEGGTSTVLVTADRPVERVDVAAAVAAVGYVVRP